MVVARNKRAPLPVADVDKSVGKSESKIVGFEDGQS
jgi:hypothetical protein